MLLNGKGFFIWKIPQCERGSVESIVALAKDAHLSHVLVKIADAQRPYNIDRTSGTDLLPALVDGLHAAGIQAWGWHYVYGDDPSGEARVGAQRACALGLDGYVIDAEVEYKAPGKAAAARRYMAELRAGLKDLPIALSSFRFPSYHPEFPWKEFLSRCDLNMPQVYWQSAHNAGAQLTRCVREFSAIAPLRPILPTGATYAAGSWMPTPADMRDFIAAARSLELPGVNFYSWDDCRLRMNALWNVIRDEPWAAESRQGDLHHRLVDAINARSLESVMALYQPEAVQITSDRTIQGSAEIRAFYTGLFRRLGTARFSLVKAIASGASRHFTWICQNPQGKLVQGDDTIGVLDDRISYHYTHINASIA
jgi:hypothetical protein